MRRFITKKLKDKSSVKPKATNVTITEDTNETKVMDTKEKVQLAQAILATNAQQAAPKVKKVRKDKGLIERAESSAIILTEDNKELLND